MSMDVDDDDVPRIPQLRLGKSDDDDGNAISLEEDYENVDWLNAVRTSLHTSLTSAPIDGPRIRQAAITDEYEEDMVTIERIRILQDELVGQCVWCWGNNGGETTNCPSGTNPRARCMSFRRRRHFPLSNFKEYHDKICHLSCAGCKMPVDFCVHGGADCTMPDVVMPFVWGQYMRSNPEGNACKDFIGNYLSIHDEGVPTDDGFEDELNVLGLRDVNVVSGGHGKEVAY
jgi:hypothetical protein